jgi:hypothetical protein
MLTEDHVLRLINQAIAALLKALGLKKTGEYEDALQAIDLGLETLLGIRADLARRLDDDTLLDALSYEDGSRDPARLAVAADLFKESGEILAAQGRREEGLWDYSRALHFFLEAVFSAETGFSQEDTSWRELAEKIAWLHQELENAVPGSGTLSDDLLFALFDFYDRAGEYARADGPLAVLLERPEARQAILPEARAFYERLLAKTVEELESGGISCEWVEKRIADQAL